LYYDLNDSRRKAIPKPIAQWLDQHIGVPVANDPESPPETVSKKKARGETTKRRQRPLVKPVKKKSVKKRPIR